MSDPRFKRYLDRLERRLLAQRGNECQKCGSKDWLEWAHLEPTGLKGEGRGKRRRLLDVKRNPTRHALLCKLDHAELDGRACPG